MTLREKIANYVPFNDQEEKDREMILKYIDSFPDVLTRENEIVHFTSSGFVLNKKRDHVLMIYHNIYDSWSWTGGHTDGDDDLLAVAIREVQEETGVKNVVPIVDDIFTIDVLSVLGHYKRGKYVTSHIHISAAYLLEAAEEEKLHIKEDENSNVAWLPLETFLDNVSEKHMIPVYTKIIDKAKSLRLIK